MVGSLLAQPFDKQTVWSGVYTSGQAKRGSAVYSAACSRCHREDFSGYKGLTGPSFLDNWREDSLKSLYVRIAKTMPLGTPGSLQERQYLDVLAYLLEANEFPPGSGELGVAALDRIRFEGREGPEAVPDFALVETVGCLADGLKVIKAAEPTRTRNPHGSSPPELRQAAGQALGSRTFLLLDGSHLGPELHPGGKVKVKGLLIRKPSGDRLNVTSAELVGLCP